MYNEKRLVTGRALGLHQLTRVRSAEFLVLAIYLSTLTLNCVGTIFNFRTSEKHLSSSFDDEIWLEIRVRSFLLHLAKERHALMIQKQDVL